MKKLLMILSLVFFASAVPARADEAKVFGNTDLLFSMGYKLWLNSWQSWDTGRGGANFVEFSQPGVASMVPMALKYKNFFTTLNLMFTGDYKFPQFTDVTTGGATQTVDERASRDEVDWNVGYYVVPNNLGITVGLKDVNQHWNTSINGGPFAATNTNWSWIGPTLGITGGAGIGNGFSIYGNGVGGIMAETHDNEPSDQNDTATYEAMEMGIAWKPQTVPMNVSFGYKYQRINTKLDIANTAATAQFANIRGIDVTSGYTLGVNVLF